MLCVKISSYQLFKNTTQNIPRLVDEFRLTDCSEYFEIFDLAIKTYEQLLNEFKKGSYASKSILRQGLIYYNGNKEEQALVKFKKVAAEYPKTAEALEAVSTARLIYVDSGKVGEYAAWVIYNRYYLNHYTISVHNLQNGYGTIQEFNAFLERIGIKLNDAGGKICYRAKVLHTLSNF